jgi:hypothetical protein
MEQAGVKLLQAAVWCQEHLSADTLRRVLQQLLAGAAAVAPKPREKCGTQAAACVAHGAANRPRMHLQAIRTAVRTSCIGSVCSLPASINQTASHL